MESMLYKYVVRPTSYSLENISKDFCVISRVFSVQDEVFLCEVVMHVFEQTIFDKVETGSM